MSDEYILMEELEGNEDLHKIAKEILIEDNFCYMPKGTTRKQLLNEIKSEIQWYLDMVYPPVTKDVLYKCYDEILAIEKEEKLKESVKIDLEISKYLNEKKIEDFMDYGADSDEGLYHFSELYKDLLDKLEIKYEDIYCKDGISDGKYIVNVKFDCIADYVFDVRAWQKPEVLISDINGIINYYNTYLKYESIIRNALESTLSGNCEIYLADDWNLEKSEIYNFKLFLQDDIRVSDYEWSENGTEVDISFCRSYCPNLEEEEEEL